MAKRWTWWDTFQTGIVCTGFGGIFLLFTIGQEWGLTRIVLLAMTGFGLVILVLSWQPAARQRRTKLREQHDSQERLDKRSAQLTDLLYQKCPPSLAPFFEKIDPSQCVAIKQFSQPELLWLISHNIIQATLRDGEGEIKLTAIGADLAEEFRDYALLRRMRSGP